jgi:PAS domain S-box-containing protein
MANAQVSLNGITNPARFRPQHGNIDLWKPLFALIIFTLMISVAGYVVFQRYKESIKTDRLNELGGIAELKVRQISNWIAERKGDAQALKNDPLFLSEVELWLQRGGPDDEAKTKLIGRLASLQQANEVYGETSISLLDRHAVLRLFSSKGPAPVHERAYRSAVESMRSGQMIISDIHVEQQGAEEVSEIDLYMPLTRSNKAGARSIGVIIFHIDPRVFLFPLIQRWPTPSPSAETLLVRSDGDEVVFLNQLRHINNKPLAMRIPLDQAQFMMAQGKLKQEGLIEGKDYRNIAVVGVMHKVDGTSWMMVSKVDKAEIYAPINHLAIWMTALLLALMLAGSGITIFWWRKDRAQYSSEYQGIIRAITERKKTEELLASERTRLRTLLHCIPDLVWLKNAEGVYLSCNRQFERFIGATESVLVGKTDYDFVNRELADSFRRHDRKAMVSNAPSINEEWLTFAEDGYRGLFETIKTPIHDDTAQLVGVLGVARDITKLKHTETKLKNNNRALRLLSTCNTALVHITDAEQMMTAICDLIVESGGYSLVWIGVAEQDEAKSIRPVARCGAALDYLDTITLSWADNAQGNGPAGLAIRTGTTQVNQSFQHNPLMSAWREIALVRGYQSSIALPLKRGGQAFGVLSIYSATPGSFNPDEIKLLEELAGNLAWGITALSIRTEREVAVEKLRKSEEHFRFLTENASDMTILMSVTHNRYDYVSPSSTRLTGFSPEEYYLNPNLAQSIVHPDWHDYSEQQRINLLNGIVPAYFEFQIIHKSGETRWMHQRNTPIWHEEDSNILSAVQGVVNDITEQKLAEEQLLQQKIFLHQIIDTDPNLIYVKDSAGKFLMVNLALAKFYGTTAQQMIGKSDQEINPNRNGLRAFIENDDQALYAKPEAILAESSPLPEGKQHWYLTIKKLLPQADGSANVLGIAVDITGQKLSEGELAESYRELQRLTSHLENIKEEERTRIARELHDEMGATLAALKMRVAWLASKLSPDLKLLAEEAGHISNLVSDGIHTVRHIVSQLRPSLLEDVGLDAAIEAYVREFRQNTNIECILILPEAGLALEAEQASAIFRILQESLSNIAKHSQASRVEIFFTLENGMLSMVVTDNGLGFVQNSNAKSFGLLGIRERALMVGGKAKISSAKDKGTRVSVSIPARNSSTHEDMASDSMSR